MTQGSGGADDVGSVPPPPQGGNESHVLAPSLGVPNEDPVPPVIDLTFHDESSSYVSVPASRSVILASTNMTRHSTVSVESIHLFNHVFKDSLIRDFVQRFRAYMPADIADDDAMRLRIRLRSFELGDELVRIRMYEAFDEYVEQ